MLPLPLHCYDMAGKVNPPRWLYWFILIGLKDWVITLFALVTPSMTEPLLALFFPESKGLGYALLMGLPYFVVLGLLSYRNKLWDKGRAKWAEYVMGILLLGSVIQLGRTIWLIVLNHGNFSYVLAGALVIQLIMLKVLVSSRHLKIMTRDWRVL